MSEELGGLDQDINNSSLNNPDISTGQPSTPKLDSPMLHRKLLDSSVNESTSPLAVFASSPQAMYRRVMVCFSYQPFIQMLNVLFCTGLVKKTIVGYDFPSRKN